MTDKLSLGSFLEPERTEELGIRITLTGKQCKKVKKDIERLGLGAKLIGLNKDDRLLITYKFYLLYYGVVKRLEAILNILKKYGDDVAEIDTEEFYCGRCLIQELFLKFNEIGKMLANKQSK